MRPLVNQNSFRANNYFEGSLAEACLEQVEVIIGGFRIAPAGSASHPNPQTSFYATLLSFTGIWNSK